MPSENDTAYRVAFSFVAGIGPIRMAALEQHFESLTEAWNADRPALRALGLDRRALDELETRRAQLDPLAELERVTAAGLGAVSRHDPRYPRRLREIADPPALIYVRGELSERDEWSIAVVGTRRPTPYGRQVTRQLTADLADAGLTIVSGLARGVDAIAHTVALEQGARTVAVVAGGLDRVYPPEHKDLAKRIVAQGGAIISEYPLGRTSRADHFPRRNRIIAGLTLGTLVTEAGEKSGTWHTVNSALDYNREVFAVPGPITSPQSSGANQIIKTAHAKLVTSVDDISSELQLGPVERQASLTEQLPEDPVEAMLLGLIGIEPTHVDLLARAASMPVHEVTAALATLELKGMIHEVGPLSYARR